jgi:hypothetical protein
MGLDRLLNAYLAEARQEEMSPTSVCSAVSQASLPAITRIWGINAPR